MKIMDGYKIKTILLVLVVALVAVGVVACGKRTSDTTYKLTHSSADAEYILGWDSIVSRCPDIEAYEKQEVFVRRGESAQTTPGTPVLNEDSPAAWTSYRFVQTAPSGEKVRGFGIWTMYFENDEYLDEVILTQMSGFPVQKEGEFVTGVLEAMTSPMKSDQLLLAGKHFIIYFIESASPDESLFFTKEELIELLPSVKSKISSLEITPLPSDIPERNLADEAPYEWYEFMTFLSGELSPPVRVPEEQFYNNLIFSDRPWCRFSTLPLIRTGGLS